MEGPSITISCGFGLSSKRNQGLGETLPNKFHGKWQRRRRRRYIGADDATESSESDTPPPADDSAESILADRTLFTRYIDSGLGTDLAGLPVRYLAPGSVRDLWRDMKATGQTVSYCSFVRTWDAFKNILRFRAKGDFAQCDQCAELQKNIKNSRRQGYRSLVESTQRLHVHYANVGRSRDMEESLRTMLPTAARPCLFIVTDGMDQSHWSIPRIQGWRGPKGLSGPKIRRPRCKMQGCWAFHHSIDFFIADPVQAHDGSMTCEVLARCLENCQATARSRGLQLPAELVVLTDNTVRENKCQTLMMFLTHLQQRACFQSVAFVQHIKGHTHNILDQLFGVISRAFQFCDYLPDIWAVAKEVEAILRRPTLKSFLGAAEIHVSVLESVRDWATYMNGFGISISGGLKLDLTANHCFIWLWSPWVLTCFGNFFCFTVICLNFVSLYALKFKNPPPCKSGPQEKMFRGMTWRFYSLAQLLEGCWALSLTGWTPS